MHDVLIVLGFNTDPQHPVFRSRVDKAVELYNQGLAPQIIMSGCCSDKLDIQPKDTEATLMADYAMERGVPAGVILLEEDSVDTLGNFYYSKMKYLEDCSWYHVGFVSTEWHTHRSNWLAEMVLGPDYEVTGYSSATPFGWTDEDINTSRTYNVDLLEKTKTQLAGITPGDHESIEPFLGRKPRSAKDI